MVRAPYFYSNLNYSKAGYFFLLIFSFLAFSGISPALERISFFILLCITLANFNRFSFKKINPILLLSFTWFIYIWLNTFFHLAVNDFLVFSDRATLLNRGKDWSLIAFFPIVSLFLNSDQRRSTFILFAGIGLLASIILSFKNLNIVDFFHIQARYGSTHSINHFALFIGTALIGAVVFGSQLLEKNKYGFFLSILVASFSTFLLVKTQSRMSWLAISFVMIFIFLMFYFFKKKGSKKPSIINFAFILLPCFFVILFSQSILEYRLSAKEPVIRHGIVSADHSINGRVELFKFGYEKWLEKPFFGHGPIDSKILISQSGSNYISELWHLHNTYLEVIVCWGIVGLVLCAITIFLLLKSVFLSLLRNEASPIHCLFFLSSILYWLLWLVAEFNIYRDTGQYYWLMLAGLGYSIYQKNN